MSTTIEPLQLQQLDTRIKTVWLRGQKLHLASGLLTFFRWAVLLFLASVAVDWMVDIPGVGRVIILVMLLAVSLYKAWKCGLRNLRAFDPRHTALQIENQHGGLDSLLVSAVQFRDPGKVAGVSQALRDRTFYLAEEAAETIHPDKAVPYQGLRNPALLAVVFVLIIGVFAMINGPFVAAAFGRIFAPWLAIEYPIYTQLDLGDGDLIVKEGDGIRLEARVSGVVPASAKLTLRTGEGEPRERSLAVEEGACEYPIEAVFRSFEYRIAAGDARSSWRQVRVISAPRIERAEVRIEFPTYTQRPTETVEALTVTVPEGTRMHWKLTLDRAVSNAEFRPAGEAAMPMGISADGRTVTMQQVATESRAYSFGWVGKSHGFAFDSPRHYVQVAPDRRPHVELTSPSSNLYATLQRKLNLAFRARDDHGIGEAVLAYRVNKTTEVKVQLPETTLSDGSEQQIDWDYHESLPDLAVGDTLSFVVELADRYPGADGPHRVRSDARRLQFVSEEDYLKQIEKQKHRLLTRLQAIYREERAVYDSVSRLDPSDELFIQTFQQEAIRQDLMRDRINVLQKQMNGLVEDLAANNLSDAEQAASLVQLAAGLQVIADEHVGRAASMLREVTALADETKPGRDPASAIQAINSAARELALLVFQLGFKDAADVMARELHATSQAQAALRLQTIIRGEAEAAGDEDLAKAQTRLAEETARLLAATPRNKESTSTDALVAFNLSRMVNELLRSGADTKMKEAGALILKDDSDKAARLHAGLIASLLRAEFRLRRGAEYEALTNARDLFNELAAGQKQLREEGADISAAKLARSQAALHRQLHLLLMPEMPAPTPKLYDRVAPSAPPVDDVLVAAEHAMRAALTRIEAGDRAAAAGHQQQAQAAFEKLAEIAGLRMEAMTKRARMKAAVLISGKQAQQLLTFEERLLMLLEQTEDAAHDNAKTASLAGMNQALADDVGRLIHNIVRWKQAQASSSEDDLALIESLRRVAGCVGKATTLLKENKPDDAIEFQEQALDALEEAAGLNEELTATRTTFTKVLTLTESVLAPSPKLVEIEAEQIEMAALTEKAKPEEHPGLVIPQKNLIHAVNAVVSSLDPLAHKIESGTVLLFAKEDMDAAAIGLETDDIEDALDAQSFVVESLQELRAKVDHVTPQYRYVLEVTENLYEIVPQSTMIRTGTRQWLEKAEGAPDAAALKTRIRAFGEQLQKLTGEEIYVANARQLESLIGSGAVGEGAESALDALLADAEAMQLLMDNLAYLITPPLDLAYIPTPTPEVKLLEDVLLLAAHHKDLSRQTRTAAPEQLADFAAKHRELLSRCAAFIPRSNSHPRLVAAHRHLSEAVAKLDASNLDAASSSHHEAGEMLRYFILEYTLKYVMIPPTGPQDPGSNDSDQEIVEQLVLELFEPGALTGDKPKDGRLEWEVLGRRDRAALNENFARELPLEYRAILKDYYERLTR